MKIKTQKHIYNFVSAVLTVLICFFALISICALCFCFVLEPHPIAGLSMYPLLNEDAPNVNEDWDIAYVNKNIPYERGDIVVANVDWSGSVSVIKHVVAFPGDTLKIREEGESFNLYVNNNLLYSKPITVGSRNGTYQHYVDFITRPSDVQRNNVVMGTDQIREIKLFDDEYFLLGYNWEGSIDSMVYGVVNSNQISGKVEHVAKHKQNRILFIMDLVWKAITEI